MIKAGDKITFWNSDVSYIVTKVEGIYVFYIKDGKECKTDKFKEWTNGI